MFKNFFKLILLGNILLLSNFCLNAATLTVTTITEALNYSGDKNAVIKLVVTGEISGEDYSENSE